MWHFVTSCDILWHLVTYCDILWHLVTSCDILWHLVTSCDILWHLVTSCDILWHLVTSCDILWQQNENYKWKFLLTLKCMIIKTLIFDEFAPTMSLVWYDCFFVILKNLNFYIVSLKWLLVEKEPFFPIELPSSSFQINYIIFFN